MTITTVSSQQHVRETLGQQDDRSLLEAMMALPVTADIELSLPDRTLDQSAERIPDLRKQPA